MANDDPTMFDETNEEWRDIPGFEGFYQASSEGRVRSIDRFDNRNRFLQSHLLKPAFAGMRKYPRLFVVLSCDGIHKSCLVHGLVTLAFIGEVPEGKQVNHLDGNPLNNRLVNLEYVTPKENIHHAYEHGLKPIGSEHHKAIFTEADIPVIRARHAQGESMASIARSLNVSKSAVDHIVNRRNWKQIP